MHAGMADSFINPTDKGGPMRTMLAAVSLVFAPAIASACTIAPEFRDLDAFLKAKEDIQVIFLGRVKSVVELPQESDTTEWNITFEAGKWWRGIPQEFPSVLGGARTRARSTCEGVDDFSAKEGEQWLIVGTSSDGKIHPVRWLSTRLENGKLPIGLEQQLGAPIKSSFVP